MTLEVLESSSRSQEDHWIPLSDLMTGLMMMFLVIAITFMVKVEREAKRTETQAKALATQATAMKNLAIVYGDIRSQIYDELYRTFKDELPTWRGVLSRDLSIRFEEPNVQFDTGLAVIKPDFTKILSAFFPRYVRILNSEKFKDEIEEVRIEGHTSSAWKGLNPEMAYYENMRLSQDRTRAVLQFVFGLPDVRNQLSWLIYRTTANGLSSSRPILIDGKQDAGASQRVEFRVKTKAEDRLAEMLKSVSR